MLCFRPGGDSCPLLIKGVLIDISEPTTEKQFVTKEEEKKDLEDLVMHLQDRYIKCWHRLTQINGLFTC